MNGQALFQLICTLQCEKVKYNFFQWKDTFSELHWAAKQSPKITTLRKYQWRKSIKVKIGATYGFLPISSVLPAFLLLQLHFPPPVSCSFQSPKHGKER